LIRLNNDEENTNIKSSVAIEDIGIIILDNQQIVVSLRVLQLLLDNNSVILVCNERHMPHGLMLPYEGHTTQSERYKAQLEASLPLKKQLWQQTVSAKIFNQARFLQLNGILQKNMLHWAKEVTSGDGKNHEARAAAYYWDNIFSINFKRERFGDFPNNLLNYGYAILRAVIARSLVASGLLPAIGIHHHNKYNAYCLADDIMEPYRPFVDKIVLGIIEDETEEFTELTTGMKKRLFEIPVTDVFIAGQKSPLMIASQRTAASLASCFAGESRKILYPEFIS
jgi:CRISPR-associated protein Cas1